MPRKSNVLPSGGLPPLKLQGKTFACARKNDPYCPERSSEGCDFRKAELAHAELWRVNVDGTDFGGANLTSASLWNVAGGRDRFRLFSDLDADALLGVIKSQTDPDLLYSCRLASDGSFGCCTQNLNVCGGLRGQLCKHLLVLIVGLVKAGALPAARVYPWVVASREKGPELDRDEMSDAFLRYKGAEAGQVDWRPTETIPEDYYAL